MQLSKEMILSPGDVSSKIDGFPSYHPCSSFPKEEEQIRKVETIYPEAGLFPEQVVIVYIEKKKFAFSNNYVYLRISSAYTVGIKNGSTEDIDNEYDKIQTIHQIIPGIQEAIPLMYKYVIHNAPSPCSISIIYTLSTFCPLSKFHHLETRETRFIKQIVLKLCKLIKLLHTNCIAHNNLTASNILIDEDYNLSLIDFSFAVIGMSNIVSENSRVGDKTYIYNKGVLLPREKDLYSLSIITGLLFFGDTIIYDCCKLGQTLKIFNSKKKWDNRDNWTIMRKYLQKIKGASKSDCVNINAFINTLRMPYSHIGMALKSDWLFT